MQEILTLEECILPNMLLAYFMYRILYTCTRISPKGTRRKPVKGPTFIGYFSQQFMAVPQSDPLYGETLKLLH